MVDRLVLGDRAGGYLAVRTLLQRMATTLPVDEVVPALAETAGRTVHSPRAEVRLNMSDGDAWSQVWPPRAMADESPGTPETIEVEVRHAGTEVGEIQVDVTEPAESDRDRRLLDDLARPAGLALSTVRLTLELRRRAAELEGLTAALEQSNRRIRLARESALDRIDAEMRDRVMPFIDRATRRSSAASALARVRPARRATGIPIFPITSAGPVWSRRGPRLPLRWTRCGSSPAGSTRRGWPTPGSPSRWKAGNNARESRSTCGSAATRAVLHGHQELESCLYFSLVTALGSLSAGSGRPVAVVEIGATDVAWRVTGTAVSTGHQQGLQAVRDRVEAFGGVMSTGGEVAGDLTVRATLPLTDGPVLPVIAAGRAGPAVSGDLRGSAGVGVTGAGAGAARAGAGPPVRSARRAGERPRHR